MMVIALYFAGTIVSAVPAVTTVSTTSITTSRMRQRRIRINLYRSSGPRASGSLLGTS
jgi:hypothetical protein